MGKIIYCKNCGQELQSNWILCPRCKMPVEINQQFKTVYKARRRNSSQFAGICIFTFGVILTIFSMGLLYFYNYWTVYTEDGAPEGVILSSIMLAFGFIIIIGGIYMIWKKSKYLKRIKLL